MHVWDFLPKFAEALESQLRDDERRWGGTWLNRPKEGQEARIEERIKTYFDQYRNAGVAIPWLKIAGLALIAWIRETQLESEK